jgi:excisionase family DNA binding protein
MGTVRKPQHLAAKETPVATAIEREPYVSVRFLADHFKVPQRTIRELAKAGKIPALRIGKHYRFELDRVTAALALVKE